MARRDDEERSTDANATPLIAIKDESTKPHAVPHRLVCVAGPDLGRTFKIATPTVMIGRGPVDVSLRATDVSRHHARIFRRSGSEYAIEDLGSANKTFVNGHELAVSVVLRTGDRIQVGADVFVFSHHDELEDRMHQLQRMESLSTLAVGLAHDFNNSLSVILGGLELLERRLGSLDAGDEGRVMLDEMRGAAGSAIALAQRLLRLARTTEAAELEPVQLAPLVQRTIGILRRQLPPVIKLVVEVPAELVVRGSHEELHQILVNFVFNARDAMPTGGTLSFTARRVSFDRPQATARLLPEPGDYVELAARDTGAGMDADTLARVFEPFFTTKPPGQGTGLGLAMVHGIVRRHGGSIVAESEPGHGTAFTTWLPVA